MATGRSAGRVGGLLEGRQRLVIACPPYRWDSRASALTGCTDAKQFVAGVIVGRFQQDAASCPRLASHCWNELTGRWGFQRQTGQIERCSNQSHAARTNVSHDSHPFPRMPPLLLLCPQISPPAAGSHWGVLYIGPAEQSSLDMWEGLGGDDRRRTSRRDS